MKPLSELHKKAVMQAKTIDDQNKAAAMAMIETPIEMIKAIMLKHELAVIEVMRELHEAKDAAVRAERQRIVNLLMIQHEAANGAHNYWHVAAQLIQADVAIEQAGQGTQKTPLRLLNLTVRSEHLLRRGRVYDVETLQSMDPKDILAIPGFGKKSLSEIMDALIVYEQTMERKVIAKQRQAIVDAEKQEPLYLHQVKTWVGLTDEERYLNDSRTEEEIEYARAIEAKLKEKNT